MPQPITFTPEYNFEASEQDKSKAFELTKLDTWLDIFSAPGEGGGGMAFYIGGFKVQKGTAPVPARIDWRVYAGSPCMADDEPCAEGSTFLPKIDSENSRSGLLFQVSGRRAGKWYLRARLPPGSPVYQVGFAGLFEAVPSAGAVGDIVVIAGPVIG